MKKILVTGANGYIGRHVVKELLDGGARVTAVDVRVDDVDERADRRVADIFSGREDWYRELGSPDVCLHMAWRDGFIHNADTHMSMLSAHYDFVRNLICAGLGQIAVMGSMHEIGYFEGAVTEDTPCNPVSKYGIAKDSLRRALFALAKEKPVKLQWLRAYYIYGDDKRNNSIFAKLTLAAEEGKETFPFTTGKSKYDFIKVSDLAAQLSACVMQDEVLGVINCCSGKPVSLAEQVEGFIREKGFDIRLEYGAFPDRAYDSPAIWGDDEKIKKIMGNSK